MLDEVVGDRALEYSDFADGVRSLSGLQQKKQAGAVGAKIVYNQKADVL